MATNDTMRKKKKSKRQHQANARKQRMSSAEVSMGNQSRAAGAGQKNKRKKKAKVADAQLRKNSQRLTVKKRGSKRKRPTRVKRSKRLLGQLLLSLFLTIGLIWLISVFTFTIHRVDSYMMMPSLTDKDVVFVNKVKKIRRFDLVLLRNQDGSQSVRRVIGIPGDRLYYKNDQLYLNDAVQVERFITEELATAHQNGLILTPDFSLRQATGEEVISKNNYFVLGDNRQYAKDSRSYGLVKSKDIIGIVQLKLLPLYDMRYLQ